MDDHLFEGKYPMYDPHSDKFQSDILYYNVRIILYIFYIMIPILHFMRVDYTLYTFIRSTLYVLLSIYLSITLRTILSTYVSLHLNL